MLQFGSLKGNKYFQPVLLYMLCYKVWHCETSSSWETPIAAQKVMHLCLWSQLKLNILSLIQYCMFGVQNINEMMYLRQRCHQNDEKLNKQTFVVHSSQRSARVWTKTNQLDLGRRWRQFHWPCAEKWAKNTPSPSLRRRWVTGKYPIKHTQFLFKL